MRRVSSRLCFTARCRQVLSDASRDLKSAPESRSCSAVLVLLHCQNERSAVFVVLGVNVRSVLQQELDGVHTVKFSSSAQATVSIENIIKELDFLVAQKLGQINLTSWIFIILNV